jgi:hypothetical protein
MPPAPTAPLVARIRMVPAAAGRPMTTFVVTFNRAVTGVTLDDFTLARGRTVLSLAQARITTTDNRTFTISNVRGTNLAGSYSLQLKSTGTGIADAWAIAPSATTPVTWRMLRTVRA